MSAMLPTPRIRTSDGAVDYQCTGLDVLTLARSIRREGPSDASDLAWCYAQRLALFHARGNRKSLASIITSHSQPINPRWFPDGEFCRPGGQYHGTASCANAASRPANASIAWENISSSVRESVTKWARAETSNGVPRATDFAAADLVARKIAGSNPLGFRMVKEGSQGVHNSFVSENGSHTWSPVYVTVEYEGRVASAEGLPLAAKIALGIVGAIGIVGLAAVAARMGVIS